MLPNMRLSGFDPMAGIGIVAAVATLSCWLWLYKNLLDYRWLRGGQVRSHLSPSWNPVAWWVGALIGLLLSLWTFLIRVLSWFQLRWGQDWIPLLFVVVAILSITVSIGVSYAVASLLSLALYPFQVMALALIHATTWSDRLLVLLADIFIVISGALSLIALSQARFLS